MTKFKTFSENQFKTLRILRPAWAPCFSLPKVCVCGRGGGGGLQRELSVLAILNGGAKHFHPLKGGVQKVLPS